MTFAQVDEQFDRRLMFNQKTTALLIGISTQAFSKWGVPPSERRGRESFYYWPDIQAERDRRRFPPLQAEIDRLRIELGELDPDGGETEHTRVLRLDVERARLASEQADKIAMENAITRGQVAFMPDVAEAQQRVFEMIRARALGMATKIAPLANPENPNLARDVIEREAHEFLTAIASFEYDDESVQPNDGDNP